MKVNSYNKQFTVQDVKRVEFFDTRYYKTTYTLNKKSYTEYLPSVTEILSIYPKKFLSQWRGDVGNERADQIIHEALKLGSIIHYAVDILNKGGIVLYNPLSNPIYTQQEIDKLQKKHNEKFVIIRFQAEYIQILRIHKLLSILNFKNVVSETTVYSLEHKFAGTLDFMGQIEGGSYDISGSVPLVLEEGVYLVDVKTGKGVDDTYKMQISAYMQAVMDNNPVLKSKIKGGLIVHSNNDKIEKGIKGLKTHFVSLADQQRYFNNFLKVYDVYKIHKPIPNIVEEDFPTLLKL